VDDRGTGLALVEGSERQVLAELRRRWPGLPIDRLPYAIETETTNGNRTNPTGLPARAEIAYAGGHRWVGLVVTEHGQVIEVISTDTKAKLLALLRQRWPELPVREVPFIREENPPGRAGRKEAAMVTDRCRRLRANAHPPPGPKICAWCGTKRGIEVAHISGNESDGGRYNLAWVCRSCNVRCGNTLRAAGLGRATVQFNPAEAQGAQSLGQWLVAIASMKGESTTMPVAAAVALIRATDPETRSQFAQEIWRLRRQRYGPTGRSDAVPF
jgi:hypothetical protein